MLTRLGLKSRRPSPFEAYFDVFLEVLGASEDCMDDRPQEFCEARLKEYIKGNVWYSVAVPIITAIESEVPRHRYNFPSTP